MKQVAGNLLILLLQVIFHLGHPMDCHIDAIMDIAIRNALGQFSQFLGALPFQLLADTALSNFLQDTLNIRGCPGISGPPVVIILFHRASFWCRERTGVGQRDTPGLLFGYGLA